MMPPALIGMWSLGSGAMLAWGLAAAIPLAIHLWSRRRHQEIAWAAMEFLLAAMRKHSRRLRLEQLALLAVRMLLLILLAVAFADPLWSWSTAAGVAPLGATHYLLVVDTSFSMSFRERDETALQKAQQEIHRLVNDSQEGDGFSLLLMQRPVRIVVGDVTFDRSEILRQVDRVSISHQSADLPATLAAVEQLAKQVRGRYPRLTQQQICVFTDLGQNTWSQMTEVGQRETVERLAAHSQWVLRDAGVDEAANLAVTALTSSQSHAIPGERMQLTAEVQALGTKTLTGTRIEFLVNGRVVHGEELRLPAGGRQSVSWQWISEAVGDQVLSARIAPDSLLLDNERWLVIPVRDSLSVLCVEGEPDAAEFVALALNPESRIDGAIQTTVVSESALVEQDLDRFDCVFVCNVGRLTTFEAAALQRYVTRGGALVISLGDQVQADHYNREMADGANALLPARLHDIVQGEHFFDPLEYRHPLVHSFRGRERSGLLTAPIWRYFRLQPMKTATIALGFSSRDPAVVETAIGRGRSVIVATALSTSSLDRTGDTVTPWTALPAWPSFPPLVHGLLQMAVRGRESDRTIDVGAQLVVPLRDEDRGATVVRPDQQKERLAAQMMSGSKQAIYAETTRRGVYEVEIDGEPDRRKRMYAANLESRESNLRRIDRRTLPKEFRSGGESEGLADFVLTEAFRQRLFRPLLAVVGALLLVEHLLAVAFARKSL